MEVILKKTKITNSILKQALRSTEIDFKVGELLGWCIYDKMKYIVCYRTDIKSLSIFPMFKDLTTEQRHKSINGNDNFAVNVSLGRNYTPMTYVSKNKEDNDEFVELLKKVKHNAEIKGQFFV
ncbi:hypothetical protein [Flavobacterium psychrophilum]|uniref:hypothetical protein n=1 Tax=Flavobacterium psychrophilum TaxID=96345 RepID=UPI000B7C4EF7|nr:hypothetical protein [Flavobacterium psychrophilum]MBF2025099.1 hypothetical protein [Flavobacterium psychrophilum]MCB5984493.1 hypothetical protein [Flavobacterium psychrophilum]MCB5995546.1 hypothetical protein [Flavobacterium psychrophilum]MCB5997937.1 hypothetical protein [Flavobacterium psychrophilum]MCB6005436.1 hypothetical protein [Flavobacterium psychrophilum]